MKCFSNGVRYWISTPETVAHNHWYLSLPVTVPLHPQLINVLAACSNMCSLTVVILKYAHSGWCSHFSRLRTPCLWPLGMRSWEGLRCLWTYCPHQTSHSQCLLQRRSHLRRQTGRRLSFWNYISHVLTTVYFKTEKSDEWLACLPLRSERLFSEDELNSGLPATEGLMVM